MSRSFLTWMVIFGVAVVITWQSAQSSPAKDEDAQLYRLFVDTLEHVDRSYVKNVDRKELIISAINGMLGELDPYSTFIPADELDQFSRQTTGKFGGVGIQIDAKKKSDPFLTVISPLVGTPAYNAGVLAGDRIMTVDGQTLEGLTHEDVVNKLTGEPATTVKITLQHRPYDKEPIELELKRAEIRIESVMGYQHKPDDSWDYMIDPEKKIGYVRIAQFMPQTAGDLKKALEAMSAEGVQAMIMDLRYNPGGLLSSAIEVCDLFLKDGTVVSTKGRNTEDKSYGATPDIMLEGVPIAILTNHGSASASEIVAACLQDHKRAVVVGERSFGKGSVQNVIELEDGKSALKLTTASYRRPSGKNIHKFKDSKDEDDWGVRPDDGYAVEFTPEDHMAYRKWRNEHDRARGKSPQEQPAEPAKEEGVKEEEAKKDEAPAAFQDKQVNKALEYLRAQIEAKSKSAA